MSRIGRAPITLPSGVTAEFKDSIVTVTGPKGSLTQEIFGDINVDIKDNVLTLTRANDEKSNKEKHGLYRSLVNNMVKGVTEGFSRNLVFNGVGYKIQKTGNRLVMNIGLSHSVSVEEEGGCTIEIVSPTEISIKGIDKCKVGQFAAKIRAIRPVEPYHGYGIRYNDEVVNRKVFKSGKK